MYTLKLDWDEKMLSDQRLALIMLRQNSSNPERRQRITKMIDDIDSYLGAVAEVTAETSGS